MRSFTTFSMASLILSICLLMTSCSPITRASGQIIDSNGNPVVGADISIQGKSVGKIIYKNEADGNYSFDEIKLISHENPIEIKLVVSKKGYKTVTKDLSFGENNQNDILLEFEN